MQKPTYQAIENVIENTLIALYYEKIEQDSRMQSSSAVVEEGQGADTSHIKITDIYNEEGQDTEGGTGNLQPNAAKNLFQLNYLLQQNQQLLDLLRKILIGDMPAKQKLLTLIKQNQLNTSQAKVMTQVLTRASIKGFGMAKQTLKDVMSVARHELRLSMNNTIKQVSRQAGSQSTYDSMHEKEKQAGQKQSKTPKPRPYSL